MKKNWKKGTSLFLATMTAFSMTVSPVMAAEGEFVPYSTEAGTSRAAELEPPTSVTASADDNGFLLDFGFMNGTWAGSITKITIDGEEWEKVNLKFYMAEKTFMVRASDGQIVIGEGFANDTATCVISATGYKDLTLTLDKTNHSAVIVEAEDEEKEEDDTPAVDKKVELSQITITESSSFGSSEWSVAFSGASDFVSGIQSVTVNDTAWSKTTYLANGGQYKISDGKLLFAKTAWSSSGTPVLANDDIIKITSTGYQEVTFKFVLDAEGNATAEPVSSSSEKPDTPQEKEIALSQIEVTQDSFSSTWNLRFKNADDYVSSITEIKVNDAAWEKTTSTLALRGGNYKIDAENKELLFAQNDATVNPEISHLKSGDIITITADGYKPLTFKFIIDKNGDATAEENDGKGDTLALHVKIEGDFEAAIVGQKNYDSVGGASSGGGASSKNSSVTVYGALVEKDTTPGKADWEELNHESEIDLSGKDCFVTIEPDTAKGTDESKDSGMKGVYATYSSALELSGTPKDAGHYLVSVTIKDEQGRTATSNTLPFRIYTGEETLAEQIAVENLKQYESGLYAWDIMEPWAIKNFGSNVAGEENSVRVPADLEAWFGSHTSGTYGYLGYDIAWADVVAGNIPQTLYIPDGCHLTITNMQILSSVRIVVENGGKLTLSDSVVQGIIDVKNGGTLSMNYDSYAKEFTTGASICGQIRLADGATLENAAIYSNTNYLANGDLTDRANDAAVVLATGNVNIKGQVFIQGDAAGGTDSRAGQAALKVKNGTLQLAEDAVLVTYGGNSMIYGNGGTAIQLENGKIEGNGKVVAIGGSIVIEKGASGGNAVSGNGTISAAEVFLQGATAYTGQNVGKAINGSVSVSAAKRSIKDGTLEEMGTTDPLADLYWRKGVDAVPPLEKFVTENFVSSIRPPSVGGSNGSSSNRPSSSRPSSSRPSSSKPSSSGKPAETTPSGTTGEGSTGGSGTETTTLTLTIGQTTYQHNGENKTNDVAPIIQEDRTFLPIRKIAEALGAEVAWNGEEKSVTITDGEKTITVYIGQNVAVVNGETVTLDASAFIETERTYLPLRFIAENLGAAVTWDAATKTITIVG